MKIRGKSLLWIELFEKAGFYEPNRIARREEIEKLSKENGLPFPQFIRPYKIGYMQYALQSLLNDAKLPERSKFFSASNELVAAEKTNVVKMAEFEKKEDDEAPVLVPSMFVPKAFKGYVPFGNYDDVYSIIASKLFYTMYVVGPSGNGKTLMIEQVAAKLGRELIRANITAETDEDDLIGGYRLIKGETVWQDGPVVEAMKRGAILLLDEVDLGTPKLMCLQPVLEGKPIFVKKINKLIEPAHGFNVIATANTKGKGSVDGNFIGTMVMNEAFLERFAITFEQDYPEKKVEVQIINEDLAKHGLSDPAFAEVLVNWADITRTSYKNGSSGSLISTRRLVHIINAYSIFNRDRIKALKLALNRFEDDVRDGFLDLYKKCDGEYEEKRKAEEAKRKAEEEAKRAALEDDISVDIDPSALTKSSAKSSTVPAELQSLVDYLNNNPTVTDSKDYIRVVDDKLKKHGFTLVKNVYSMKWEANKL